MPKILLGLSIAALLVAEHSSGSTSTVRAKDYRLAHQEPKLGTARKNSKGMEFVYVPAGEFTAGGSSPGINYGPVRKIFLDAYWIGKNDVTVSQFADYCESTGYKFDWDGRKPTWGWEKDDRPMVNVTWDEARAYCKWAGGDLPTEAQWEKAARGTDGRQYPWGNQWLPNRCWVTEGDVPNTEPAPVGSFIKGASPYGCLDMVGNVYQWCLDWDALNFDMTDLKNPTGPGFGTKRIIRGACFVNKKEHAYTWYRWSGDPNVIMTWGGLRCVMTKL